MTALCSECGNEILDGRTFHLIGGINVGTKVTVEEEIQYEYDGGNLCVVCYNFKISLIKHPSTNI